MAINIQDHDLVPDHRKLDEDEIEDVLDAYNIDKENLPEMDRKDALAKKRGYEPGDVIEITRESATAGETTYYRVVVDK